MELLTVFTPAYNRKHTIGRTYESLKRQTCKDFRWLIIDDGSTDGTRELVLSWAQGSKLKAQCTQFDWMGRAVAYENENENSLTANRSTLTCNHFAFEADGVNIEYIYKPNGGLYTGYNVAFQTIQTELCVCIDSDDYMPDDAVEKVSSIWKRLKDEGLKTEEIAGITGLDYSVKDGKPIGGEFKTHDQAVWMQEIKKTCDYDVKYVYRTELMRAECPQIGFEGEKDFNPHYMQMHVFDQYKMWVVNENLCWVDYQYGADSMSEAIFKQFKRSPRSYAKYRLMELSLVHGNSFKRKFSLCAHYVSACIFSHDGEWLRNSKNKLMVICAIPLGIAYNLLIRYKARR